MSGGMDNPVEVTFDATGEVFFTTTFVSIKIWKATDWCTLCIEGLSQGTWSARWIDSHGPYSMP